MAETKTSMTSNKTRSGFIVRIITKTKISNIHANLEMYNNVQSQPDQYYQVKERKKPT